MLIVLLYPEVAAQLQQQVKHSAFFNKLFKIELVEDPTRKGSL